MGTPASPERPLWHDLKDFLAGSQRALQALLSRWDDLGDVNVREVLLCAALAERGTQVAELIQHPEPSYHAIMAPPALLLDRVLRLIERGAPMGLAVADAVHALTLPDQTQRAQPLPLLLAAAHWAGRGPELRRELADLPASPPRAPAGAWGTGMPVPYLHGHAMPLSEECEAAIVRDFSADILARSFEPYASEDNKTFFASYAERLVQGGTDMEKAVLAWYRSRRSSRTSMGGGVQRPRWHLISGLTFGFLRNAARSAGREAELLEHVRKTHMVPDFLEAINERAVDGIYDGNGLAVGLVAQEELAFFELQSLHDSDLLGLFAPRLRSALEQRHRDLEGELHDAFKGELDEFDDLKDEYNCIAMWLLRLEELAAATGRYGHFLARGLAQHLPEEQARLVATFVLPERRRPVYTWDQAAYTWEEFEAKYVSEPEARKEWARATPEDVAVRPPAPRVIFSA